MALLNNTLSVLLNQRITWLNARGNILVGNIAASDNRGATRKELKAFKTVLQENQRRIRAAGKGTDEIRELRLDTGDILTTKTEIAKELEMLEMSNNALEHDSLINIVRNFHRMMKSVLGKNQ